MNKKKSSREVGGVTEQTLAEKIPATFIFLLTLMKSLTTSILDSPKTDSGNSLHVCVDVNPSGRKIHRATCPDLTRVHPLVLLSRRAEVVVHGEVGNRF